MDTTERRVPITLLTGFLGAGKTTLLNTLIRDPKAGRIAVIINEFGDVDLDHDLIEESTEETILLPSGCLCCSIRGDLLNTLGKLIARRSSGAIDFDRVVIETTGIAEPGPIMHSLVIDRIVAPFFRLDGVVTVADVATGPNTLETQAEAVQQLAMADLVVLSKTDLVTTDALSRFETQIADINGGAQRIVAAHGQVPTGALFDLSGMDMNVSSDALSAWLGTGAMSTQDADPHHDHHHDHDHHHAHAITSAAIEIADPIHADVFDHWLDTLIALKGPDILRVKGIAHVEDVGWPFVFHGVQHIFDVPVPLERWSGGDTTSRIVVIARNMTKAELEASLATLRLQPEQDGARTKGMMAQTADVQV